MFGGSRARWFEGTQITANSPSLSLPASTLSLDHNGTFAVHHSLSPSIFIAIHSFFITVWCLLHLKCSHQWWIVMSRVLDRSIVKRIRMTKGEECLYLHTNVFIISRASKWNRIRQEIRISIIWMLTGKNVMLLNTECMWCFLEKDVVCWHTGDMLGKKRESWKEAWALQGKIQVERTLLYARRLSLWDAREI